MSQTKPKKGICVLMSAMTNNPLSLERLKQTISSFQDVSASYALKHLDMSFAMDIAITNYGTRNNGWHHAVIAEIKAMKRDHIEMIGWGGTGRDTERISEEVEEPQASNKTFTRDGAWTALNTVYGGNRPVLWWDLWHGSSNSTNNMLQIISSTTCHINPILRFTRSSMTYALDKTCSFYATPGFIFTSIEQLEQMIATTLSYKSTIFPVNFFDSVFSTEYGDVYPAKYSDLESLRKTANTDFRIFRSKNIKQIADLNDNKRVTYPGAVSFGAFGRAIKHNERFAPDFIKKVVRLEPSERTAEYPTWNGVCSLILDNYILPPTVCFDIPTSYYVNATKINKYEGGTENG